MFLPLALQILGDAIMLTPLKAASPIIGAWRFKSIGKPPTENFPAKLAVVHQR